MENHRILIVGGSRGLGKGLGEEFLKHGSSVAVTVRSDVSHSSDNEGSVEEFKLDLNNPADGERLKGVLSEGSYDAIVLNAGIFGPSHQRAELTTGPDVETLFMTNAISPVRLARQLLPVLRSGGVMAFMSSRTASIALNDDGEMELYRASKSALNALVRSFAVKDALPAGIGVLLLHPGWVQTEMGGAEAPVTIASSAAGLRLTILKEVDRPTFQFRDYLGDTLSW